MAGVALLARDLGLDVSGSDVKIYPPMSTQLMQQGIALSEGYDPAQLEPKPDLVVIGNALSRGNPMVESVLDLGLPYTSGAQWLADHVLLGRWVMAVAGTHGKTTTASMLAWILEFADRHPGFLIGGIPENFGVSARLGDVPGSTSPGPRGKRDRPAGDLHGRTNPGAHAKSPFFVIEADEYDTAFFDKRSKFVHYRPRTAVLNNLEYDHADIFPDLAAIKLQFHHFIRTVPRSALVIVNGADKHLADVLATGCWAPVEKFNDPSGWRAQRLEPDGSRFQVWFKNEDQGDVTWPLIGDHNISNALAAIAAAHHVGVSAASAVAALAEFRNVKRRLEVRGCVQGVTVYDDFAHHPTAIATTLAALRARVGNARIVAVLESRSNTMRLGVHRDSLAASLSRADRVLLLRPKGINWNMERVTAALDSRGSTHDSVKAILDTLGQELRFTDHVLIMSNGGFENIHARLLEQLQTSGTLRAGGPRS